MSKEKVKDYRCPCCHDHDILSGSTLCSGCLRAFNEGFARNRLESENHFREAIERAKSNYKVKNPNCIATGALQGIRDVEEELNGLVGEAKR